MALKNNDDIFKKFSETARRVLINAQQIAVGSGSSIGSEHILLSLSSSRGTLSYDILREYLVSPDQIRLIIGSTNNIKNTLPKINKSGKIVLKRAIMAASKYRHASIDSEHLLLGCLSEPKLISYKIIQQLGIDPEKIKLQLINLFQDLSDMDNIIQNKLNQTPFNQASAGVADQVIDDDKKMQKTPALDYFTIDLTKEAKENKLDNVVGRDKEIQRALQILSRRTKNNPVFVGEPGVGKTALVEGIAQMIVDGKAPQKLLHKKIISLDLPLVVAGTMYRGQFEERLKKILEEISKSDNVILFIDEIHNLIGAGSAEGSIDAASIIKPALIKNKIRIIGATTSEEYRKYIEKDNALERRLQPIKIKEPSTDEAIAMIKGLSDAYEKFHNVKISNDCIKYAVELSNRYISDRYLPDKAIDVIDEAAAAVTLINKTNKSQNNSEELKNQLDNISLKKEEAVKNEDFEKAVKLKKEEDKLTKSILETKNIKPQKQIIIKKIDIARVISETSGIPIDNFIKGEYVNLNNLESIIGKHIVAQDEAVKQIAQAIRRNKAGIGDDTRPIGSFIFLGPTGVGKTELAKVLAKCVYVSDNSLIKIDMSEFMERHNVSRLIGAPPGYVGYEEAGKLTETVRKQPYSLILFDEIEKAHPEFFNILLQILDDGYITDAQGRRVDFRNTLIIMTSNIGLSDYYKKKEMGFAKHDKYSNYEKLKKSLTTVLKNQLKPEFINRIDRIVVFNPLKKNDLEKIVKLELDKLSKRMEKRENINIQFCPKLINWIIEIGTDIKYGARPLKRTIQEHIENLLADQILSGKIKPGKNIKIDVKSGKLLII